jgi:hypothetical protein
LRNKAYRHVASTDPDINHTKRNIISLSRILLKRAKKVPYDPGEIRGVVVKGKKKRMVRNQHKNMQVY